MNVEDILARMLQVRQDLTREKLLQLLEDKKAEAHGLLSDEGAARLVAQDLLITIDGRSFSEVKISDLVTGLNDVTLSATVLVCWPIQEFQKQNGSLGKLLKLVLMDKTGTIRCALWNNKAEQLAATGELQGKVIQIAHGYTREGLRNVPELNGGDRCEVTILRTCSEEDYVGVSGFFKEFQDVNVQNGNVNIIGVVNLPPRISKFRRDEQEGILLRTTLVDGVGEMNIVAWNDKAKNLLNIKKGDTLQVIDGRVKAGLSGSVEVHLGNGSLATVLKEKPPYLKGKRAGYCKISELKSGTDLALHVRVVNVGKVRDLTRGDDGKKHYVSLLVGDDTGLVRLFLWDDKTEFVTMVHPGTVLLAEGVYARERKGELFVTVGASGMLKIDPQVDETRKPGYPRQAAIGEIDNLLRPVIIEGTISDEVKLENFQVRNGESTIVARLVITDGSGRARLSLWRELAEKASNLKRGMRIKVTGVQPKSSFLGEITMSSNDLTLLEVTDDNHRHLDDGGLISHYI